MVSLHLVQQPVDVERTVQDKQAPTRLPEIDSQTYVKDNVADHASKAPRDLIAGLCSSPKHFPCRFLYDKIGSQLYNQITTLEEYYPFETEKRLLLTNCADIVQYIPQRSVIAELGVGDADKTGLLLNQLIKREGRENVHFCGIDCSSEALRQARCNLQRRCPDLISSNTSFLEAEYLEGVAEVRRQHPDAMLCLLWLGSSVGNFSKEDAAQFLKEMMTAAGERSQILLCTDMWKDHEVLRAAYNDSKGVTEAFIKNGLKHALRALHHPEEVSQPERWEYLTHVNPSLQQVEMYLLSKHAVPDIAPGIHVEPGEAVLMEVSRKFTPAGIADLAYSAGLCIQAWWGDPAYRIQLLLPPRQALLRCWQDTDALFSCILDWDAQPIGLRHAFSFYFGHVASFARLKMLPKELCTPLDHTLSRGIDPNVLDPTQCHSHPPILDKWPSEAELRQHVAQVRKDILDSLDGRHAPPPSMHAVCMTLEHERMHQETLCYMLAQQRKQDVAAGKQLDAEKERKQSCAPVVRLELGSPNKVPPSSQVDLPLVDPFYLEQCSYADVGALFSKPPTPDTQSLQEGHARQVEAQEEDGCAQQQQGDSEAVRVPGGQVKLGLGTARGWGFAWDVEVGVGEVVQVAPFSLPVKPVTVQEYRHFLMEGKAYERRELWDASDWRSMLTMGINMPATWSLDSQSTCRGALMVHMPEGTYPWEQVANCPAYVSLSEALAYCRMHGGRIMTEAEYASGCRHLDGWLGNKGAAAAASLREGGWEWTSSPLNPFQGFQADPEYPEYSNDFFDGCHFVLKGSSPYTHPSLRRDSFRNFYQKQYPYVFAKFRMIRCVD